MKKKNSTCSHDHYTVSINITTFFFDFLVKHGIYKYENKDDIQHTNKDDNV